MEYVIACETNPRGLATRMSEMINGHNCRLWRIRYCFTRNKSDAIPLWGDLLCLISCRWGISVHRGSDGHDRDSVDSEISVKQQARTLSSSMFYIINNTKPCYFPHKIYVPKGLFSEHITFSTSWAFGRASLRQLRHFPQAYLQAFAQIMFASQFRYRLPSNPLSQ